MERLTYKKGEHYYTKDNCIIEVRSISDNEPMYDCEHCEFMKRYQEDCRKLYNQKGE